MNCLEQGAGRGLPAGNTARGLAPGGETKNQGWQLHRDCASMHVDKKGHLLQLVMDDTKPESGQIPDRIFTGPPTAASPALRPDFTRLPARTTDSAGHIKECP